MDLAPLPLPCLPGPFITRLPLTVTDGSDPGLAPHQRQNHTAHGPTDSWSTVSSGRKTAAINNPRHMIRTVHGRERGRESDGGPEGRCHIGYGDSHGGLLFNQVCGDWIMTISQPNWRRAGDEIFKQELCKIAQVCLAW